MTSRAKPVIATTKKGSKLTEEVADQLAHEAEAGYDLTKARKVGRRSLAGTGGRSPRLNIRITPDLARRTSLRAQREGKTLSEVAREALEKYVAG